MREVEIKFERENQEGVVAVGTYLIDGAKRFGIRFEEACLVDEGVHHCSVTVPAGAHLLSPETSAESKYFAEHGRITNERLACQTKIDGPGEVIVMTKEKVKEPKVETNGEDRSEQYRKEFAELPLEKKIANLVQLETIALGETVSFIINSPFKVADKMMDVMAEFGFKKEEQQKDASRPAEHKENQKTSSESTKSKKKKNSEPENQE
jgi:ferredoxin